MCTAQVPLRQRYAEDFWTSLSAHRASVDKIMPTFVDQRRAAADCEIVMPESAGAESAAVAQGKAIRRGPIKRIQSRKVR